LNDPICTKTIPSRETAIIAFSDKKINKFSDTLDYIKVHKGDDYGTGFLFDPNEKYRFIFQVLLNYYKFC
jgi:hypothetical protein